MKPFTLVAILVMVVGVLAVIPYLTTLETDPVSVLFLGIFAVGALSVILQLRKRTP